jgi:hypothetical protein
VLLVIPTPASAVTVEKPETKGQFLQIACPTPIRAPNSWLLTSLIFLIPPLSAEQHLQISFLRSSVGAVGGHRFARRAQR